MCGIIGIWAKNNRGKSQIPLLEEALDRLNHRGPDHKACKLYSNCGFGHTRLAIIDTDSRSNQPFSSPDGRYTLIFNGEIYNFRELRENLKQKGAAFHTSSDTEVVFRYLIEEGENALQYFNGFFSFAFYDREKDEVLLARDRMGIKPLVVYADQDKYLFASEISAFAPFDVDQKLDRKSLNYYFSLTYVPAPSVIFKNVTGLGAGELAIIREGAIRYKQYYTPKVEEVSYDFNVAKDKLRELLRKSVADRMVADVPLGCFLSGGVDSSVIAALAIRENPRLKTFSIGFDHPYFNESEYAKEVSEHIGSDHYEFKLTKADFKENFTDFLTALDVPFADSSAFAVYLLSKKVREKVTVALSGDGADELFGGYRKHFAEYKIERISGLKKGGVKLAAKFLKPLKINRADRLGEFNRKIQKFERGLQLDEIQRYWTWCQFISSEDRKALFRSGDVVLEIPVNETETKGINRVLKLDQKLVLPNDMLKKVDAMSMAHALEVRTPFLDHHVVEFANSLPAEFKVNRNGGKQILKAAFADLLPDSVLLRSKKGFEIPIKEWLEDDIETILGGRLFSKDFIDKQGLFNHAFIIHLKNEWRKPHFGDRIYLVWALVVFQHWWDRVIKKR